MKNLSIGVKKISNMTKKRILIVDTAPLGTLVDTYKWAQYLSEQYKVTFLTFKSRDKEHVSIDGVKKIELPNYSNRFLKGIIFLLFSIIYIIFFKGKVIVEYFDRCELLQILCPWKKMLLDVRTLSVLPNKQERQHANDRIKRAVKTYKNVSAISRGVANFFGDKKVHILPLGSDVISTCKRDYTSSINILYVGTFTNRDINKTLLGVIQFHNEHKDIPINYTIIGYGANNESFQLESIIQNNNASSYINLVGKVQHEHLMQYFDLCNVGFSFVPITEYYQYQPPTKTYEYSLSGLVTIATNTYSNSELIQSSNGILIQDTVEDIINALEKYWENRSCYSEHDIRKSLSNYQWSNIVNGQLSQILNTL